jgi:hypothetical protein
MKSELKPIGHRFLARESAILLALMLVLCKLAIADTLTVKQDGTGQYTQIQQALDAALNNDVVLVYPGTYFENIVMPTGNLELCGTYVLSGNRADIYATVVDGNHNGSCVQFTHDGYQYVVNGLVFQNGSGTQFYNSTTTNGGGFYIDNSDVAILNCIIQNNYAASAGGVRISNASVFFSGNIIKNNRAITGYGGIIVLNTSEVTFDTIQLNSIFNNYGPRNREYGQSVLMPPIKIKLDTVTTMRVNNYYHFTSYNTQGYNTYLVEVEGQTGYYGYIELDVYVSPQGDDANSGISPDEPLKSLSMALTRIVSDSLIERSIHLAPGTYSATATGELFPLQFKHNVSIKGAGSGQTTIDLEGSGNLSGLFIVGTYRFRMHGVTIQNGALPEFHTTDFADFYVSSLVEFRDVVFSNADMYERAFGPTFQSVDTAIIDSCRFIGNIGGRGVYFLNAPNYYPVKPEIKLDMYTTVFSENTYDGGTEYQTCPQLALNGHNSTQYIARADVVNCLFDNNSDNLFQLRQGVCINARESFVNIVNSTFAHNVTAAVVGAAIYVRSRTHVKAWNSIFYQNQPNQFTLYENSQDWDFPVSLEVSHSMVTDGLSGIANIGTGNTIVYHPSNINTDPLFTGYGDFPYSLSGLSPCIDAGTLELPEGITLPATDLAGNPRVWGGSVDMGAYEFNPVTIGESRLQTKTPARLVAAPNPFVHELSLTVTPKTGVPVRITVHNLLGREVARLLEQTDNRLAYTTLHWNGRGSAGENLPAGAYIISLVEDGKEVESLRVVKSVR